MGRKRQRKEQHYLTIGYRDGAVTACLPKRKPSAKSLEFMGDVVDDDFVYREYHQSADEIFELPAEVSVRLVDVLANRINTRRAVRELVLPELKAIRESLETIHQRLDRLERNR